MNRHAKIVVTLGPATDSPKILEQVIRAGADVARLNFSHGSYDEHRRRVELVRKFSKKRLKAMAILMDLQGPRVRIGRLEGGRSVQLVRNARVEISTQPILGTAERLSTTYTHLPKDVKKKSPILLQDGRIELEVLSYTRKSVRCRIVRGGWLRPHAGMNLPGTRLSSPALTPKDLRDLNFGLKIGVDAVALSFVRNAGDILRLKKILKRKNKNLPIIAKIEKAEALEHLDEILKVADGVMVARGDLGVEISLEQVPSFQKEIIAKANHAGKIVITATQMLDSMIENPLPTRAEASDVANAIYDGTDAVMLSAETALGKFPVEAVSIMAKIILRSEHSAFHGRDWEHHRYHENSVTHAIVHAACQASEKVNAKAIMVFSISGATVRMIAKVKPRTPILGIAPNPETCRRMALYWGVHPILSPWGHSTEEMIRDGERGVLKRGLLKRGDRVVIVSGTQHILGATNVMKVHSLGDGL